MELLLKRWILRVWPALHADPWEVHKADRRLINKPIYRKGTRGEAVLFLHGWTSTPYEFRPLAKTFHEAGYTVSAPLLSGHGTVPKDLENVEWEQWLEDAERAYRKLAEEHARVYVAGISLGGSLAIHLARRVPEVSGLILLGTPFTLRFEKLGYYCMRVVMLFKRYKGKMYPPTRRGLEAITRVTSYSSYPIKNGFEAFFAIVSARGELYRIKQPCYILHAQRDHLAPGRGAYEIYSRIASPVKKMRRVPDAYHTFIVDPDKEDVRRDIVEFVKGL